MTVAMDTSPFMGQPKLHESDTFTGTPASRATAATPARASNDCPGVIRRLERLWLSLADITRFSLSAPDSIACSAPRRFGTSAA